VTENEQPPVGEAAVLARLADLGYPSRSLADLRHSGVRYSDAVPILLDALQATTDPKTVMELVRALSVPWAKPLATPVLIDLFRRVDDQTGLGLRWAVGNALEASWDDSQFERLVALAQDRSFGRAREMVVLGLGRSKRPEAGDLLIRLLDDPDVNGHAVGALEKLKIPRARAGLERMMDDPRAWVRKSAARALRKLPEEP
jgi:HEAT repeat protein